MTLDFTNHFLIAVPGMLDDFFERSVVYICEHTEQGALGLVVNKPVVEVSLQQLFDKVNLRLKDATLAQSPVYYGGPVQPERGFVLHDTKPRIMEPDQTIIPSLYTASLQVTNELKMTSSQDILEAIAEQNGPSNFLITLGYSGWEAGQLEEELMRNCWLTVPGDIGVIFDTPSLERYDAALRLLGIDAYQLVGMAGHA